MNSSAELHLSLGAPLRSAHLDGGATPSATGGSAAPSAASPGASTALERAEAEVARLRAELEARNGAEAAVSRLTARVDSELARIEESVRTQLAALGSDVVALALAAAGRVLNVELTSPTFDLGAIVSEALDRVTTGVRSDKPIRVRASSHDLQTLDKAARMHPSASERVVLEVDPALARSQVVLECDLRRIVVDVKAEFERLKAALSAEDDPHG